ncbi:PREDICTED: uncharacterized protein LOC105124273 [Populus euphratica]|uniref:Uncharacterized protein LOC105124273 n=1 Tax=Populus euphratica TaxID=75702 RepID=A0AAJ6U4J1_POPEU|nr:PREDICTED: uncharacterized protein LOC105124273 [Populus euphratica]
MASCQCSKPVEHPCNQDQNNHSSSQKVGKQAEAGIVKTGTHSSSQTHSPGRTNGMTPAPACNARTNKRGERKKGLLQRIKDGISGHSNEGGSSSSSSSESESDDEKCGKRKN